MNELQRLQTEKKILAIPKDAKVSCVGYISEGSWDIYLEETSYEAAFSFIMQTHRSRNVFKVIKVSDNLYEIHYSLEDF